MSSTDLSVDESKSYTAHNEEDTYTKGQIHNYNDSLDMKILAQILQLDIRTTSISHYNVSKRPLKNALKWANINPTGHAIWTQLGGIVPMKMPYDFHDTKIPNYLQWTGNDIARRYNGQMIAVVDLTDHRSTCYTTKNTSLVHLKLQLTAKQIPSEEDIFRCNVLILYLLHTKPLHNALVGIHCHYGFNRTGYIVCSFLMDHCGMSALQAMHTFAMARSPGIKHEYMSDALKARENDSRRMERIDQAQMAVSNYIHAASSSSQVKDPC